MLPLWQRSGTCQPNVCGSACCRFMWLAVDPQYLQQADMLAWVRLHGIDVVEWAGWTMARIPIPCTALDGEGRCSLYGMPERPTICSSFPVAPADLLGIDAACTFTFQRGG